MTDLDTGPSSIRDDSICEPSLNKSSGDIVERLPVLPDDHADFTPELALEICGLYREIISNQSAEIERLRREVWLLKNDLANANDNYHEVSTRLESAVAAAWEEAEDAVRKCASLDENGYICEKSAAIKSIRASAIRTAVSKKTGEV